MNKFILLFILLLLFSGSRLYSHISPIDSLKQEIEESNGERKLELLLNLVNKFQTGKEQLEVNKCLEEEALKQNNMRYIAASNAVKAKYFTENNNLDSTIYYAELANEIYRKYDIKNPNQTYYYMGRAYIYDGFYELGIHNIKKYIETTKDYYTYFILAEAYYFTKQYDLAKETVLTAIRLFENKGYQAEDLVTNEIVMYDLLANTNMEMKEYQKAKETCSIMEEVLQKYKNQFDKNVSIYFHYRIYSIYATIYLRMGNLTDAKKYVNEIEEMPDNELADIIQNELNVILAEYYLATKEYSKSLYYQEIALDYFTRENSRRSMEFELYMLRIKALEGLGKYQEALILQQKISQYKDSVYQINAPLQILKISGDYERQQFRLKQEKGEAQLEKRMVMIIGLALAVILLLIILYIVYTNQKKEKRKNQILFKQYSEIDKYIRLLKENTNTSKEELDEKNSLFEQIDKYVKDEEAYKNAQLTRDDVAKKLNTNSRYIIEAIKEETGMTFSDYVNQYRLNYARRELISNPEIAVSNIILDSGISSVSAFYRLFKNEFGMTPNELRQIKANIDAKIQNNINK